MTLLERYQDAWEDSDTELGLADFAMDQATEDLAKLEWLNKSLQEANIGLQQLVTEYQLRLVATKEAGMMTWTQFEQIQKEGMKGFWDQHNARVTAASEGK